MIMDGNVETNLRSCDETFRVAISNTSCWIQLAVRNPAPRDAAFAWQPRCHVLFLEDLGRWLCVPRFHVVCLFQAKQFKYSIYIRIRDMCK